MAKRRPNNRPGRGRVPRYDRPRAVAQRAAVMPMYGPASPVARPVMGPQRGVTGSGVTPNPAASASQAAQQHRMIVGQDQLDSAMGRAMHRVGVAPAKRSLLWRHKGKFALGGTAAVGGTAYLYRHHQNGSKTVAKLYDPFAKRDRDWKSGAKTGAAAGVLGSAALSGAAVGMTAGVNRKISRLSPADRRSFARVARSNPKVSAHLNEGGKLMHSGLRAHGKAALTTTAATAGLGAVIGRKRSVEKSYSGDTMALNNPFGSTELVLKSVSPRFGAKNAFTSQPSETNTVLRPAGRFTDHASHANSLDVFHPKYARARMPRQSKLMRYTKGNHTV